VLAARYRWVPHPRRVFVFAVRVGLHDLRISRTLKSRELRQHTRSAANSANSAKDGPAPAGNAPGRGCLCPAMHSAKGPVSRILSCAVIPLDAALPRTFISDLPGGFGNGSSRLGAPGRCAALAWLYGLRFPPYLVLLRVGFTLTPALTGASGALLPHHFTLTPARTPGQRGEPFRWFPGCPQPVPKKR
jgi:hypothetical protein